MWVNNTLVAEEQIRRWARGSCKASTSSEQSFTESNVNMTGLTACNESKKYESNEVCRARVLLSLSLSLSLYFSLPLSPSFLALVF